MKPHDLIEIPARSDSRGDLCVIEASQLAGYDFKRVFYFKVNDPSITRGGHAHKALIQFMVCLHGKADVSVEDKDGKRHYTLDSDRHGLLALPGTWVVLEKFSPGAIVMVFASDSYDEDDYIRDYSAFKYFIDPKESAIEYAPMKRLGAAHRPALMKAVGDVIDSGIYIGGPAVEAFEKEFAAWCGAEHAVACGNGLDALALILEAYGIGRGDEVIVQANTCIATALAVTMAGATPVLVDCRNDTYGIDTDKIEAAVTPRTRAIMPVHLYGIPAEMDAIRRIAQAHKLKIIEDAAQGHGGEYKGRRAGTLGDAAGFSFYPTKNLGAFGDGGAVVTNDTELAHNVRVIANYGATKRYYHDIMGRNSRLDPMQAAMLSVRLKSIDSELARRAQLAQIYYEALSDLNAVQLPQIPGHVRAVWHIFPLVVAKDKRDALIAHLAKAEIGTLVHYPVPVHLQKCYGALFAGLSFPVSEDIANRLISLPLTPYHTDAEIRRVAATIKEFLSA